MSFWSSFMKTAPHFLDILLGGAVVAVEVAAGALLVALAGGLILALMTVTPLRPLRWIARAYIELIRGTPALTQLFIIYFGLADIGLGMPPLAAAITGLGPMARPIWRRSTAPASSPSIAARARRRSPSASRRWM